MATENLSYRFTERRKTETETADVNDDRSFTRRWIYLPDAYEHGVTCTVLVELDLPRNDPRADVKNFSPSFLPPPSPRCCRRYPANCSRRCTAVLHFPSIPPTEQPFPLYPALDAGFIVREHPLLAYRYIQWISVRILQSLLRTSSIRMEKRGVKVILFFYRLVRSVRSKYVLEYYIYISYILSAINSKCESAYWIFIRSEQLFIFPSVSNFSTIHFCPTERERNGEGRGEGRGGVRFEAHDL